MAFVAAACYLTRASLAIGSQTYGCIYMSLYHQISIVYIYIYVIIGTCTCI